VTQPAATTAAPAHTTHETIAFIGGGNMAASLIGGLRAAGQPGRTIRVSEPDAPRAALLAERYGVTIARDNVDALHGAQIIVIATKPQVVEVALKGLRPEPGATVISIAAGVRIASLLKLLGVCDVVRAMPNTPALVGAGVTGVYVDERAGATAKARAERVLGAAGAVCWVAREELIDAVTAVSGSGPAYFFLLTEVMREAGVALGLDATTSAELALHTFAGAANMAADGATDVPTLRANVTSKGGTTEAALRHLEGAGIRTMFVDALRAAADRGRALGDELAAKI
jgi:pyrroline-5-carboxylate reductase